MMAWLVKVLLIIGCLLGIYVFLVSISPKAKDWRQKEPILKPLTLVTTPISSITPTITSNQVTPAVISIIEITFDGNKFSPINAEVNAGSKLLFKNTSQSGVWIASDPHPIHNLYSELNSGRIILPGESFEFVPSKIGIWGYHNDLLDGSSGKISGTIRVK